MTLSKKSPQPRPGILEIQPYVGGKAKAKGANRAIRLASNENPLGASSAAIEAFRAAANSLHRYPDGGATQLREAIGAAEGLPVDRLVCGAGSDELIQLLVRGYAGPGDEVLYSQHGFLVYPLAAMAAGARPVAATEHSLTADVDALLAAVSARTRMVFLANPNNPTGSYLGRQAVARLRNGLPEDVLLVLDAAYAEYVEEADYDAGAELVAAHENVAMLRTFSKIHGLAALRLGWVYGPKAAIDVLNRIRGPFNVTAPAQAAGLAAIGDSDHVARSVASNAAQLARFREAVLTLGLEAPPSVGNFQLVRFPDPAKTAKAAKARLAGEGVLVRGMTSYGLPDCLRITIGLEEDMDSVIEGLRGFLA
ncbi:MAG: histidinol-phosphate transaminase [Rhodospirillales bacterium]|nr:histidinol-phosphate transaminase [Rhodospirillales bacterium]